MDQDEREIKYESLTAGQFRDLIIANINDFARQQRDHRPEHVSDWWDKFVWHWWNRPAKSDDRGL